MKCRLKPVKEDISCWKLSISFLNVKLFALNEPMFIAKHCAKRKWTWNGCAYVTGYVELAKRMLSTVYLVYNLRKKE